MKSLETSLTALFVLIMGLAFCAASPLDELRKQAEAGDLHSQVRLGFIYETGSELPQDYAQSLYWYRKAAEKDFPKAQHNLGVAYRDGHGVAKADDVAAQWFRKAANQGLADSQYNLGVAYLHGEGVPQDRPEAAKWFQKAAGQGYEPAQRAIGLMNETGKGTSPDSILNRPRFDNRDGLGFNWYTSLLLSPYGIIGLFGATGIILLICFYFFWKRGLVNWQIGSDRGGKISRRALLVLREIGQDPTMMSREQWGVLESLEARFKNHWGVRGLYMLGTIFLFFSVLSGLRGVSFLVSGGVLLFLAAEIQRNLFETQFRAVIPARTILKPQVSASGRPRWANWLIFFLTFLGLLSGYRLFHMIKTTGGPRESIESHRLKTGLETLPLPHESWINSKQGQSLTQAVHSLNHGLPGRGYTLASALVGLLGFPLAFALYKRLSWTRKSLLWFGKVKLALNVVPYLPMLMMAYSLIRFSYVTGAIPAWAALAYAVGLPLFNLSDFFVTNILYIALLIILQRINVKNYLS